MPRKTKIIFILVFIFVGAIMLGIYFYNSQKNNKDTGDNTSILQKFNPFGTSSTVNNNTGDTTTDGTDVGTDEEGDVTETSKIQKLTDFAIAGAVFFEETKLIPTTETAETVSVETTLIQNIKDAIKTATQKVEPKFEIIPSLRYVEKATGHVYQRNLSTNAIGKISNSTIPSVHETIFDGKGSSLIYRYVSSGEKTITSFLATLGGKSTFLSSDILEVSLSPDKNRFFYVVKNKNGVTGVIKSFDETKTTQVFISPFSEWLPQWVTEQNIILTTKASYLTEGSVFSLNTTNGTLTKLFGGIMGLTTLTNREGTSLLYSASLDTGPRLNVFNTKNHTSTDLGLYGLPEKCIWSEDNINVYCAIPNAINGSQYPDYWYQGLVSFDDYFVRINTITKETSTMINTKEGTPIDGVNLFLSNKEDKLFFVNKKDYTLWSLDI